MAKTNASQVRTKDKMRYSEKRTIWLDYTFCFIFFEIVAWTMEKLTSIETQDIICKGRGTRVLMRFSIE